MHDKPNPARIPWHLVSPVVSYANYLNCHAGDSFGPRVIEDYQFLFVASGKGLVCIQENAYEACSGDLFYYGPNVVHSIIADKVEPFSLYGLHFNWSSELVPVDRRIMPHISFVKGQEYTRMDNRICIGDNLSETLFIQDYQKLSRQVFLPYFERLVRVYGANEAFAPLQLRAYVIELLIAMKKTGEASELSLETTNPVVLAIADQLDQRVRERYDRQWLSQYTAYHPDHASRLFREHTGRTPYNYFMQRKIELVKQLLVSTNDTLLEIADHVQAGSIHAFTKWFTHMTGLSPGRFRKRSRMI
ncbi:AraC family transcriptional regulator [Paenibacillus agaridevorans]|uniref:AraC family transcriptional regulator n=1 Tax=Paenibacillus agaridevorans TaxID=171404 RepID=UPI001BE4124A|nr:AraC family transcriptional regulator [Paenibacillus agaridevorans]